MTRFHRVLFALFFVQTIAGAQTKTSTALQAAADSVQYGKPMVFTATVSPRTATGSLTFYDGVTPIGSGALEGGRAKFETRLLQTGSNQVKARYVGNTQYAGSESSAVSVTTNVVVTNGFGPERTLLANSPGSLVAVADMNNDGILDLVVADANTSQIVVALGSANGVYTLLTPVTASELAQFVLVGDFTGDGVPDVAVVGVPSGLFQYTGQLQVIPGNGDGTFGTPLSPVFLNESTFDGSGIISVFVDDLNNDGRLDIFLTAGFFSFNAPESFSYGELLGKGDGSFQTEADYNFPNTYTGLALADMNGDGKVDVVAPVLYENQSEVDVLLGNGDGTFQSPMETEFPNYTISQVVVGDVNGDGKADVVTIGGELSSAPAANLILLGNGDGTLQTPIIDPYLPGVQGGTPIGITQLLGNGFSSIIASVAGGVSYAMPSGAGQYGLPIVENSTTDGIGPVVIIAGLTGDGRPDIISQNALDGSNVVLLPGSNLSGTDTTVSGPTTVDFAQPINLTVAVIPSTAAGTVKIINQTTGATVATGLVKNGTAEVSVNGLPVYDSYSLVAQYDGSSEFISSQAELQVQVTQSPSSTTLHASPNPSALGQPVTLTAQVAPALATGTVTFYAGDSELGTGMLVNGVATFTTSVLPQGTRALSAAYYGDSNDGQSISATVDLVVK